MKVQAAALCVIVLLCACTLSAQTAPISSEVLGVHDLSPSGAKQVTGTVSAACLYCHAPHSGVGGITPLWNQKLSTQTYTPYSSSSFKAAGNQGNPAPPAGTSSSLCLSCHDGTIAPGTTVAYGSMGVTNKMPDIVGPNLQSSHPFSMVLPLKDSPDLVATLTTTGATADATGAVKLINRNVECTSCHNPHQQSLDTNVPSFLVIKAAAGKLCLACHDPNRSTPNQVNPLAQWTTSIHATAGNATTNQPNVGGYPTVGQNACSSCHTEHNSPSAGYLQRGINEQTCATCHSGGTNLSPVAPNIFAEFNKRNTLPGTAHPFPDANDVHDANEPAVLNQNRHSTCVDCHNEHAAKQVATFPAPPGIRVSQNLTTGISKTDGLTLVNPAVNQYENCLRCHGTSTGKVASTSYGYQPSRLLTGGDALNVIWQMNTTTYPPSSHPVMHTRNSSRPQPSLLVNMLKIDGVTPGRAVGTQILCTDCHNSEDNREFGGTGANGPHGSAFPHILERRYEFSQAPTPGALITNLLLPRDITTKGPFALCAKCHDLNNIVSNASFPDHARHINDGFSCSVCHSAHGLGATSANIQGDSLINFDQKVVAPQIVRGVPTISFSRSGNSRNVSCTLTCHNHAH